MTLIFFLITHIVKLWLFLRVASLLSPLANSWFGHIADFLVKLLFILDILNDLISNPFVQIIYESLKRLLSL